MQTAWNHATLDWNFQYEKVEPALLPALGSVVESRQMVFGLDAYIAPLE
jgi:hypothetical protein